MAIQKSGMDDWKSTVGKSQSQEISQQRAETSKANVQETQKQDNKGVARQMLDNMVQGSRPYGTRTTQTEQRSPAPEATKVPETTTQEQQKSPLAQKPETATRRVNDMHVENQQTAEQNYQNSSDLSKELQQKVYKNQENRTPDPLKLVQDAAKTSTRQVVEGRTGQTGDNAQAASKGADASGQKEKTKQNQKSADNSIERGADTSAQQKVEQSKGKAGAETGTGAGTDTDSSAAKQVLSQAGVAGGSEGVKGTKKASDKSKVSGRDGVKKASGRASKKGGAGSKVAHTTPQEQRYVTGLKNLVDGNAVEESEAEPTAQKTRTEPVPEYEPREIKFGETLTTIPEFAGSEQIRWTALSHIKGTEKRKTEKVEYKNWDITPRSIGERFVDFDDAAVEIIVEGTAELLTKAQETIRELREQLKQEIRVKSSASGGPRGYGKVC